MIRIDFAEYSTFNKCPIWWQNFVLGTLNKSPPVTWAEKNRLLDDAIAKYNGAIIDDSHPEDVDALEFETEDDFNAFRLIWTIHG
jgi:hypothetical protein